MTGPDCAQPFTDLDLQQIVDLSDRALDDGDALAHKRLWIEFVGRVPCLEGQIARDGWARLLVNQAVVSKKVTGGDWSAMLSTALRTWPLVEVPRSVLDEHAPLPPPESLPAPIPRDATLLVDGVIVATVPVLSGDHVVQLWRGGTWTSAYLTGSQQVPEEWLAAEPERAAPEVVTERAPWTPIGRGMVGVAIGVGVDQQMVDGPPGTWLGESRTFSATWTLATSGAWPVAENLGAFWDGRLLARVPTVRIPEPIEGLDRELRSDTERLALVPRIYAGPALVFEAVEVGAGAGLSALRQVVGEEASWRYYPQPHAMAGVRSGRADASVGAGLTTTALHASMGAGWLMTPPRVLSWRLGVDAALESAWFYEGPPGDRHATVVQLGFLVRLDAVWGRAER